MYDVLYVPALLVVSNVRVPPPFRLWILDLISHTKQAYKKRKMYHSIENRKVVFYPLDLPGSGNNPNRPSHNRLSSQLVKWRSSSQSPCSTAQAY
jgi:hypothetical protein